MYFIYQHIFPFLATVTVMLAVFSIISKTYLKEAPVCCWIARAEVYGGAGLQSLHSGLKRRTMVEQDKTIVTFAGNTPFTDSVRIYVELQVNISPRAIRKRLNEEGLHHLLAFEHKRR